MDSRLSKMQIRVLITLLSFRAKNTDTVWPKREQISKRCGYEVTVISRVTKQLTSLGWLEKVGKGGFSKSTEYRITVPELVTVDIDETVTEPVTVNTPNNSDQTGNGDQFGNGDQTGHSTVTEPVTITVTELVTRKEQTNEQTNNRPIKHSDSVSEVFDYWKHATGKNKSNLDPKTKSKINARLKSFSTNQLINAITGNQMSSWHQGGNPTLKKYDSIDLIFRNDEKTKGFIETFEAAKSKQDSLEDWIDD
jgi:hypothetical protein